LGSGLVLDGQQDVLAASPQSFACSRRRCDIETGFADRERQSAGTFLDQLVLDIRVFQIDKRRLFRLNPIEGAVTEGGFE
jgi:hypothetical protein